MSDGILLIIAGLAGLGGFISVLINLLKIIKVVKDGTAEKWFQGISLSVFLAVAVFYILKVPVDWTNVDDWLKLFSLVLGFVIEMLGGQLTYKTIKGTPIVGFSYSNKS